MTSILRQIIAGPRAKHPESNLDLCYVTPFIIATSGPSGTYPQRAYRNPLDQLVKYLDDKHGEGWCIWEFRAEGTGYPDSEVHGRVRHYPWPDHHPPPFAVVPLAMAGMRKWLNEGEKRETKDAGDKKEEGDKKSSNVVVVHCKAGKGRSGTMACSYLISECGWKPDEALARFTERRMRPGFGQGVSIPSQLRWVGYVDRWTKGGKVYVERQIEILEVHTWGLRDGVKVAVEGYVEEGKVIKVFHVFSRMERLVVQGNAPGGSGFMNMIQDMAGYNDDFKAIEEAGIGPATDAPGTSKIEKARGKIALPKLMKKSDSGESKNKKEKEVSTPESISEEAGGTAVVFRPLEPIILPTSDINIDFERRNKAGYGLAMVTAVAHVWFNAYFEGGGPEKYGVADETGVFEIEWDKMDGIKGSLRKGTRALDKLAVVWKVHDPKAKPIVIHEPGDNSPIPQMAAADWKGGNNETLGLGKDLGLRTESPASASVSKASSIKSHDGREKEKAELDDDGDDDDDDDDDDIKGLKTSGPSGEEDINGDVKDASQTRHDLPEQEALDINKRSDIPSNAEPAQGK